MSTTFSWPSRPTSDTMIALQNPEDHEQYRLLTSASVAADGGQIRYAAAMYFYNRGMIGEKVLEIYRAHAKNPAADPLKALAAAKYHDQIELTERNPK
ncbi:MAG: hypothetical protein ABIS49_01450 [Aestuariivirga sp.]